MISNRSYWLQLKAIILAYSTEKSGHIRWVCSLLLAPVSYQTFKSLFASPNLRLLILDRALKFSVVLFSTGFITLEIGELVLMISKSRFGAIGLCSLFFDFSTSQVVTSAVSIAEPLLLIANSTFRLSYSFISSFYFFRNLPLFGLTRVSKRDGSWQRRSTCSVRASAFKMSNSSFI